MKNTLIIALALATGLAAKVKDPVLPHNEAWVGTPREMQIAKNVRHQLLMLPWFGVFDDLAYKINGTEVTLLGSVIRPTLKSDAVNSVRRWFTAGCGTAENRIVRLPGCTGPWLRRWSRG